MTEKENGNNRTNTESGLVSLSTHPVRESFLTAFTLVEVVVGAVIVAATFSGLLATFVGVRRYVNRANQRLVVANLARGTLNDLYKEVRQDTWDSGVLAGGYTGTITESVYPFNYTGNYTVSNVSGADYRQVTVNIAYQGD